MLALFLRSASVVSLMFFISACATTVPPRNVTDVKTSFTIIPKEHPQTDVTLAEGDSFLRREIHPTGAAVLQEPLDLKVGKKTIHLKAGTFLFETKKVGPIVFATTKQKKPNLKYLFNYIKAQDPDLYIRITNPKGETKEEKTANLKNTFKDIIKLINSNQTILYCAPPASGFSIIDLANSLLSLGTYNKDKKPQMTVCFQDTDSNGKFDVVWKSSLTYNYPPTVDKIQEDEKITPVLYRALKNDEIGSIGELSLHIKDINYRKGIVILEGKIGRGKKSISFDNLRDSITRDRFGEKLVFFGNTYKIVKISHKNKTVEISIEPTTEETHISLSKIVTYRSRTTYIPIFTK